MVSQSIKKTIHIIMYMSQVMKQPKWNGMQYIELPLEKFSEKSMKNNNLQIDYLILSWLNIDHQDHSKDNLFLSTMLTILVSGKLFKEMLHKVLIQIRVIKNTSIEVQSARKLLILQNSFQSNNKYKMYSYILTKRQTLINQSNFTIDLN